MGGSTDSSLGSAGMDAAASKAITPTFQSSVNSSLGNTSLAQQPNFMSLLGAMGGGGGQNYQAQSDGMIPQAQQNPMFGQVMQSSQPTRQNISFDPLPWSQRANHIVKRDAPQNQVMGLDALMKTLVQGAPLPQPSQDQGGSGQGGQGKDNSGLIGSIIGMLL